jgi:hypothetical protein
MKVLKLIYIEDAYALISRDTQYPTPAPETLVARDSTLQATVNRFCPETHHEPHTFNRIHPARTRSLARPCNAGLFTEVHVLAPHFPPVTWTHHIRRR